MDSDYKIISTTPATQDWWLMYEDEQGKQFYYPVAAWARCATISLGGEEQTANEWLHPMTPTFHGLLSVPVLTDSRLLYLPGVKLNLVTPNNATAYYEKEADQ